MDQPFSQKKCARNWGRRFAHLCGWLTAGVFFGSLIQAADSQPENVFSRSPVLPAALQRVAVLPIAADSSDAILTAGCEALQPVLFKELVWTEKFEAIAVRPEDLRVSSGRGAWTGTEKLPGEFFESLQREYGCDAVLFCELTTYHAYAPLVIGWRLKLVDAKTHEILWADDEIFDASQPDVSGKVWQFLLNREPLATKAEIRWRSQNSPRQFGSYTLAAILSTLPPRNIMPKVYLGNADSRLKNVNKKSLVRPRQIYGS